MNRIPPYLALLCILFSVSAFAVTYTPQQLNRMIDTGQYPDQQSPTTQSNRVGFGECVTRVEVIMSQVRDNYPVQTIVDTSLIYTAKLWTNDAAITVSCSNPDSKMVVTQAAYR